MSTLNETALKKHNWFLNVQSSYKLNNISLYFSVIVSLLKPKKIIEFGALEGYSTRALAELQKVSVEDPEFICYDLWEDYEYNKGNMPKVQEALDLFDLNYVSLQKKDFFEWIKDPEDFDLLHVDISNNGDTIEQLILAVQDQIHNGSVVIIEGGSKERDQIEWMLKYNKAPINPIVSKYNGHVLTDMYPSLSIFTNNDSLIQSIHGIIGR